MDCFWESGCANGKRCAQSGLCLAWVQRERILSAGRNRRMKHESKFGQCANCGGNLTSDHRCPPGSLLGPGGYVPRTAAGNDVSALKIKIKRLESANRSLLERVENQAKTLRNIDDGLQAAGFKFKVATGMIAGLQEYIHDKGIEEITMSGGVDDN